MINIASLSIFFWRYALDTACYVLNKISSKSVNKIPYEMQTRHKMVLSHLRVWRCLTYIKWLKTNKLGLRSDKCLFVGYPKKIKGYYFYLTEEQKVFINNRTVFLKREFFSGGTDATKIEFGKVREVRKLAYTELDLIGESNSESVEAPLRRSNRVLY